MAMFNSKNSSSVKKAESLNAVYSTVEGRKVLLDEAIECGFFATIEDTDTETLVLRNAFVRKLYTMGILVDDNIGHIVDNLVNMRYKER